MDILLIILFFNFFGSFISLLGGVLLLFRKSISFKTTHILSSFAAGTLLGTVFFDLLPEAVEHSEEAGIELNLVLGAVLLGILFFFVMERFLHWFHNHNFDEVKFTEKPVIPMIIFGDSIHNFIDGVAIAATFLIGVPLGVVTTFAVAAHEIPQEIGDFALLLKSGLNRKRALAINILSAGVSIIGALVTFHFGKNIENLLPYLISITAGFFLYIALSTIIPELHHENKKKMAFNETIWLLLGVGIIYIAIFLIENVLNLSH